MSWKNIRIVDYNSCRCVCKRNVKMRTNATVTMLMMMMTTMAVDTARANTTLPKRQHHHHHHHHPNHHSLSSHFFFALRPSQPTGLKAQRTTTHKQTLARSHATCNKQQIHTPNTTQKAKKNLDSTTNKRAGTKSRTAIRRSVCNICTCTHKYRTCMVRIVL